MLKKESFYLVINNQDEKLKEICEKALNEKYPNVLKYPNISIGIIDRLNHELEIIKKTKMAFFYLIIHDIFIESNIDFHNITWRSMMFNSFVAYLCNITNVDPLENDYTENLFYGLNNKLKEPIVSLNCSTYAYNQILNALNNDNDFNLYTKNVSENLLSVFLVPTNEDEICNKLSVKSIAEYINTTDINTINIYFFHILLAKSKELDFLDLLIKKTSIKPSTIKLYYDNVIGVVLSCFNKSNIEKLSNCMFLSDSMLNIIKNVEIIDFDDLVKAISLCYDTGAYNNNYDILFRKNKLSINEAIANREDLYNFLTENGLNDAEAFEITEATRKGVLNNKKDLVEKLQLCNISDTIIDSLKKIKFLIPKTIAYEYAKVLYWLIWYKINYESIFNQTMEMFK